MKNSILKTIVFTILISVISLSCKTNNLPKISNATYVSYSKSEQKGYIVEFELSHDSIPAKSIVINKILQDIYPENKTCNNYKVNVIAQATNIFGFNPKLVEKENGIYFKTDTADIFKPVKFKLLEK